MTAVPYRSSVPVAPELQARLEVLCEDMRQQNPKHTWLVDSGVVWLRWQGIDYGFYSVTIDGKVVQCWENGWSYVHRVVPAESEVQP